MKDQFNTEAVRTGRVSCAAVMQFYFACVLFGQRTISETDREEWHRQRGTSVIYGNCQEHQRMADLLTTVTSRVAVTFGDGSSVRA